MEQWRSETYISIVVWWVHHYIGICWYTACSSSSWITCNRRIKFEHEQCLPRVVRKVSPEKYNEREFYFTHLAGHFPNNATRDCIKSKGAILCSIYLSERFWCQINHIIKWASIISTIWDMSIILIGGRCTYIIVLGDVLRIHRWLVHASTMGIFQNAFLAFNYSTYHTLSISYKYCTKKCKKNFA